MSRATENLGKKIPVPAVDELRMARMERRLVAEVASLDASPVRARTKYARAFVGLVAVAGVVLAIALNLRGTTGPTSVSSASTATELTTRAGQSSRLELGDATLTVAENTSIGIERFVDGRTRIHLDRGSVHCEVEPRPNRPTFEVQAGDALVTVIGTGFDVTRDALVAVSVDHGIVRVTTSNETLRLHAGESWQGLPDAEFAATGVRAAEVLDAGLSEPGSARDAAPAHTVAAALPGRRNKSPKVRKTPPVKKLRNVLKGAKPIRPVVQPSHGEKARELLAVSKNNPTKAIRDLGALAARATGNEASFALYSRAYLLFFETGERKQVVTAAKQYERRFPRGREAEDMLWLRVRASCSGTTYSSACRSAAHTYRRRYPTGVFDSLAARIIRSKQTEEE